MISSHILSELEGICSHLAVVDHGRILAQGSMPEVRAQILAARRVTARIDDGHIERAEAVLKARPEVSDLDTERSMIRVRFDGGDDVSGAILGDLVGNGVAVSEWRIEGAGLEDLFLQLTADPKRGESRAGGADRRRAGDMNPVARRELQERFRTLRSPLLISVWVLAAGVLTFLSYVVARNSAETRIDASGLAGLGSVFAASSMGPFILHSGPARVAHRRRLRRARPGGGHHRRGAGASDSPARSQVSQLSGTRIMVGKLASSLAFTCCCWWSPLPLLVVPVLLGGVTVGQAVMGVVMVAGTAVTIGAVSMWISARARSMQGAVLGSYVVAAVLVFGGFALVAAEVLLLAPDDTGRTRYSQGLPRDDGRELYSAWVNPYLGLVDASSEVLRFGGEIVPSPYQPFRSVLIKRQGFAAADADTLYDPFARLGGGVSSGLVEGDRAFPVAERRPDAACPPRSPIRSGGPSGGGCWSSRRWSPCSPCGGRAAW